MYFPVCRSKKNNLKQDVKKVANADDSLHLLTDGIAGVTNLPLSE